MDEVRAPRQVIHADLFLAGGISGTADWQRTALNLLTIMEGQVWNPRRQAALASIDADEQVEWEYHALRASDAILFWFPPETLCPIALFELGVWSTHREMPLFVGTDPAYARRFDVVKHLSLTRPEVVVHDDLARVVSAYASWRARA